MWQKEAILKCECCQLCPGCCMPVDGNGIPIDFDFSISAPNCPALDGTIGTFTPLAILEGYGDACGVCGQWGYNSILEVPGCQWQGAPDTDCECSVVCTLIICLSLYCNSELYGAADPEVAVDACCKRLRLKVAASFIFPGSEPNDGNAEQDVRCDNADYFPPTSCECTGTTDVTAIFPLHNLTVECTEFYTIDDGFGPDCVGKPKCCVLSNCDFTGATLAI